MTDILTAAIRTVIHRTDNIITDLLYTMMTNILTTDYTVATAGLITVIIGQTT